ncbi:MAG: ABC transporter permease [Candidatus Ozemobacteraceae bacterium]
MNLAIRDIRHNLGRFILTTTGLVLLLMTAMGMGGIYRGLVEDAILLIDRVDADLWVVQKDTRGPFAEISRIPASMEDRIRAVPGVLGSRAFVSTTIQRERDGKPLRINVQGLSWPEDKGQWLPIVAGRALGKAHFEMLAEESLGLPIGAHVKLAKDTYTVVGHTRGMSSSSGDSMAFFTTRDAQVIQFDLSGEAVRLERAARYGRAERIEIGRTQPNVIERSRGTSSAIPALGPPSISAVLVKVRPGVDPKSVWAVIEHWPDVTVYSSDGQRDLLLSGTVDRSRRQIGLFRVLLLIVSGIIMALILYTLTIDKLHDIALLKLMGARNSVILGLIMQQALLLGSLGLGVAYVVGQWVFPLFPRRVVIISEDLWLLAGIVAVISVAASLLGIWKAMRVEPNEVLA